MGRFLNADIYISTGQGILGYNMFTYCNNNPINRVDPSGQAFENVNNSEFYHACALQNTYGGIGGIVLVPPLSQRDLLSEAAEKVKAWAISTSTRQRGNHHVYILQDPANGYRVMYVGRTTDPVRREWQHRNDKRHPERKYYFMTVVAANLSLGEAKVLEQVLISGFTLDYLENARREIAVNNVHAYSQYMEAITSIIDGATEDGLFSLIGGI